MDYEKKYKEALTKSKEFYEKCKECGAKITEEFLKNAFPELAESEDEKIRKALVDALNKNLGNGIEKYGTTLNAALTWLEKQGKSSDQIHYWTEEEIEPIISDYLRGAEHYGGMIGRLRCLKPKSLEKQDNSSIKWQKNTPDNKPAINHTVLMKTTIGIVEGEWHGEHWFQYRWSCRLKDSEVLYWMNLYELDKQGEQKPTFDIKYKVSADGSLIVVNGKPFDYENATITQNDFASQQKPKFNVGDYIVSDYCTGRVVEITNDAYLLDTGQGIPFSCQSTRLWDIIKDAKKGDVLHSIGFHNDCIFIFNGLDNDEPNGYREVATGYCCIFVSADKIEFGIQGPDGIEIDTVKPATKIQRDLLFQKMKEAGYEWDAEKKELKKIELKPAWSDEDELVVLSIEQVIQCASSLNLVPEKLDKISKWLKSLKDRIGG